MIKKIHLAGSVRTQFGGFAALSSMSRQNPNNSDLELQRDIGQIPSSNPTENKLKMNHGNMETWIKFRTGVNRVTRTLVCTENSASETPTEP
jgi:hypothetical protein